MTGKDDSRKVEYSGELELELLKLHYRFTDSDWANLSERERVIKLAVFQITMEHGEFFRGV